MQPYEYPRVPPSSLPQHDPGPPDIHSREDNRFSWVQSPAEMNGHRWQRDTRCTSELPPLSQVPDQLNTALEAQTQPRVVVGSERQYHAVPIENNAQEDIGERFDTVDNHAQQDLAPSQFGRESTDRQLTVKPRLILNHDTKQRPRIEPDENPLSPTSPTIAVPSNRCMTQFPPPTTAAPNHTQPAPHPTQGGTWHHGFYSCAEPTICMTSLFCPCITYGKTQYRLNMRSERKDPTNMLGYSVMNGSCLAFGILCGINGILAAIQHTRLRKAYDMDSMAGNVASDCVKGFCCCCCTIAQDEKEMRFRETMVRNDAVGFSNGGYTTPAGMVFAAPPR